MTTKPSIWSDEPPSGDVTIHVRHKASGAESLMNFDRRDPLRYEQIQWARRNYQFGPRVLGAQETVDLLALVEDYHREINPRRAELIDRKIARVATEPELAELERLQALTDRMVRLVAPLPIAELDARIQRLEDEGKLAME